MNRLWVLLCVLLVLQSPAAWAENADRSADAVLAESYRQRQSDVQIEGQGSVIKLLPDDNRGRRHQRFIIRLDSGQTLLVAHNIDLAPKIESLRVGDAVAFFGEYEWNEKGGTVHWTHRDPSGRHINGWLKHSGRTYQ